VSIPSLSRYRTALVEFVHLIGEQQLPNKHLRIA
jgi:hypothetical protein